MKSTPGVGIAEVWESGLDNECSRTREQGKGPLLCSVQPTRPDRGWFVAPFGKNPWWVYLASILPALLVTILIFMDQQITAVIVNRKENKLRVSLALAGRGTASSHRVRRDEGGRCCFLQNVGPFVKQVWGQETGVPGAGRAGGM